LTQGEILEKSINWSQFDVAGIMKQINSAGYLVIMTFD
jgi:hypothetical protein